MIKRLSLLLISLLIVILTVGCSNFIDNNTQTKNDTPDSKVEVVIDYVIDGDTVSIINEHNQKETVRLLLIDTPESVHPDKPVQPFGKEASNFVKKLLPEGETVLLERGNPEKDKYDRVLGYIWLDDINLNQKMLEEGYARVAYVYEPNTKYLDVFKKAENHAKNNKLNIWSVDGYVTDNDFDPSVVE